MNYASHEELLAFCEWLMAGGHLRNGHICAELVDEYREQHGVPEAMPEDDTKPVDVR